MLTRSWLIGGCIVAVFSASTPTAQAQLFGNRSLGQSLSRRTGPSQFGSGAGEAAGTLTGSERFVRGNRAGSEFVGIDSQAGQDFVGRDPSTPGRSARGGASRNRRRSGRNSGNRNRQRGGRLNAPLRPAKSGSRYHPRLDIGFQATTSSTARRAGQLTSSLTSSLSGLLHVPVEVSVEGRTATLRGVVATADLRELAEILASFEPGISRVRNELTVSDE